jgi:hypothetical protein
MDWHSLGVFSRGGYPRACSEPYQVYTKKSHNFERSLNLTSVFELEKMNIKLL